MWSRSLVLFDAILKTMLTYMCKVIILIERIYSSPRLCWPRNGCAVVALRVCTSRVAPCGGGAEPETAEQPDAKEQEAKEGAKEMGTTRAGPRHGRAPSPRRPRHLIRTVAVTCHTKHRGAGRRPTGSLKCLPQSQRLVLPVLPRSTKLYIHVSSTVLISLSENL